MNRLRCLTLILAVVSSVVAPGSPARGDFLLSVGAYQSPNFENVDGTAQFHVDGTSHLPDPTISITIGATPTLDSLDYSAGEGFQSPPSNSDPTTLFSGTATGTITLNGVVETIDDPYTFLVPPPFGFPFVTPTFLGGTTVVFDLGTELVTVTTVASVGSREALFSLSPVPEPSSCSLVLVGSLAGLGCWCRARRQVA